MRLVVESAEVEEVIRRLARRDAGTAEDARAAVEWLSRGEEDAPSVFTRHRLQAFLWYELPHKWLVSTDEHFAVAEALAAFFHEVGPEATGYAALCRDPQTAKILRVGGEGFVEAIETSGLEPPDTPVLEWSDLMTIEEALERDAVAEMLEQAVDEGRLVPGSPRWKKRQAELVEAYLTTPHRAEGTPLSRILTARRQAWLEWFTDRPARAFIEAVTPQTDAARYRECLCARWSVATPTGGTASCLDTRSVRPTSTHSRFCTRSLPSSGLLVHDVASSSWRRAAAPCGPIRRRCFPPSRLRSRRTAAPRSSTSRSPCCSLERRMGSTSDSYICLGRSTGSRAAGFVKKPS